MSELSFSSENSKFSGGDLVADFFHVCFFILSHPLYFSYCIFFSPYLLRLLSFLSPLFITTALLVLAYLTVSPNSNSELPKIKLGGTCCLVTTYQTMVAKLRYYKVYDSDGDDHEGSLEELEVYKIVFDTSSLEITECPVEENCSEQGFDAPIDESSGHEGNGSPGNLLEAACATWDENRDSPDEINCSSQVVDESSDQSSILEGNDTTGNLWEAASAIWDENGGNPDEKNCSTQVFDAAFDERSSFEGNVSTGYFLEASSVILDENRESPVEKNCSTQVSDVPSDESFTLEGNGTTGNIWEAASAIWDENRDSPVEENCSLSDVPNDKRSSLEGNGSTGNSLELAAKAILEEKAVVDQEEKEVKPLSAYFNKVEEGKEKGSMRRESNDGGFRSKSMVINSQILGSNLGNYGGHGDYGVKSMDDSQLLGSNLGSYSSMRKEKEWRRTLACKLFEERHQNVDGGVEGMDMLWETYDEKESGKVLQGIKSKSKKLGKKMSDNRIDYNEVDDNIGDEEEFEEDEELDNGQLCCLQALKFSAGKMNLGNMGRPNLVKITKALKGFGWLHHVTKHSKKGYH